MDKPKKKKANTTIDHSRRPDVMIALDKFLNELYNLRYEDCKGIYPTQYISRREDVLKIIAKYNFNKLAKNKYYDNIKKYNNIVVYASNQLSFDFREYKVIRSAASQRTENMLFAYESNKPIFVKELKKLLKVA